MSLVVRALIHSARQTSQLQRMPLATSASGAACILASAVLKIRSAPDLRIAPPPPSQNNVATSMAPSRLPSQVMIHDEASPPALALPRSTPSVMIIVWPVKSSAPANTTSVSAIAKVSPITSERMEGSSPCPIEKMAMMPRPT